MGTPLHNNSYGLHNTFVSSDEWINRECYSLSVIASNPGYDFTLPARNDV